MACNIFMRIDGITEECCTEKSIGAFQKVDHADESYVISVDHKVSVAVSRQSGAVTGNRKHDYFTVKKMLDKGSPLMHDHLVNSRKIPKVELYFYSNMDEYDSPFYTIELEDAKIVDIITHAPDILDIAGESIVSDAKELVPYEIVSFVFDKIAYHHNRGNTSTMDSWMSGAS